MTDAPKTPARLAAVLFGLLAAAWTAFVLVRFGGLNQAILGVALFLLLGVALCGAWLSRPALAFYSGFGLLAVALAVGYYLGLFLLPTVALCWAAGMTAGFASPATEGSRKIDRLLGWGLFVAMLAYAGFWAKLTRSAAPHDAKSATKTLTPSGQ